MRMVVMPAEAGEQQGSIRNRRKHRERKGGSVSDEEASGTGGSIGNGRAAAGTEGRHRERKSGSGDGRAAAGTTWRHPGTGG